ncbi:MAG TPA: universal stress protein [Chthoniobacterales bacterium]|nr:universal stress protein [Chthoniobacterales bacterium]
MQTTTLPQVEQSTAIKIKRILVPMDFSPASQKALDYALRLGEAFGSTITLLHVVEPAGMMSLSDFPLATQEADFFDSERKLKALATSSAVNGQLKWKVRTGVAGHEIVETAKQEDVDLIVIATHGLTGWKHFCIGSTAERVARAASCPVLVVREKEHEFI